MKDKELASVSQSAATRDHSLAAPEAEPAAALSPYDGDLWWIANDGESGFGDATEAYDAATGWGGPPDRPIQLSRAKTLPEVWAVQITLTWDDEGEPDDTEVRCFNTEAEAIAALGTTDHD